MTGIKKLRRLASARDEWVLGGVLADIADEIERERECERDTIENLRLELCEARDAAAWVRDHGGLDHVKSEWRSRVPYDRYEARRQRLLGHIAECETALGKRNERISELEGLLKAFTNENADLRRHAMPEGCEWPRYDSGELVQTGATFLEKGAIENVVASIELSDDWFAVHGFDGAIDKYSKGERVKRVKRPAVPAGDGEPLEAGQTVWKLYPHVERVVVKDIYRAGGTTVVEYQSDGVSYPEHCHPSDLTHAKPEIDTWKRIEEDAESVAKLFDNLDADASEDIREIVRRCRALAERERGE